MLDFLGDIGGLFGALGPLCASTVTLFQYRGSYMYLASTMLSNPERPDDLTSSQITQDVTEKGAGYMSKIQWSCFNIICFNCKFRPPRAIVNKVFKCCKMSSRERIYAAKYKQMEKEISISYIVRTLRVIKEVVKDSMTDEQWLIAFEKHSLLGENSENDSEEEEGGVRGSDATDDNTKVI